MTLWPRGGQAGILPHSILGHFIHAILFWSAQIKGHILRLKLSHDPSPNVSFFSLTSVFYSQCQGVVLFQVPQMALLCTANQKQGT